MSDSLFQVKNLFFDSRAVMSATDRATRRVLSRFGAYVRRSARSSVRKRKRSSAPGKPPSSHTGRLRDLILFSYDPGIQSVVIGPAATHQLSMSAGGSLASGLVPPILEYGGTVRIPEVLKNGRWQRPDFRSRRRWQGLPQRIRSVRIEARPTMGPAFEKEQPKLPAMWRDSVKG